MSTHFLLHLFPLTGDGNDFMAAHLQLNVNESLTTTSIPFRINIVNDRNYEPRESFTVELLFAGEPVHGVKLNPNSTEVVILDDDGMI